MILRIFDFIIYINTKLNKHNLNQNWEIIKWF